MDALLRYILYQIAYSLLIFELILMLSCCLAIVLIKFITRLVINRRNRKQDQIGNIIDAYLFNDKDVQSLQIPQDLCQFRNLVETLERYDHRFTDLRWVEIKEKIVDTYLLPKIESYASSFSWFNRQLAARCLLLCPNKASEKILSKLLDDSRFLVRVAAAVCITQTQYQQLFYRVVRKMSKETLLSQFPYRDALIQASEEKYHWLESLLVSEKDKALVAICLDILSTRYSGNLLSLIKPHINDPDKTCRILAIKALGNIPNDESIELLINHLDDSDWNIRAESIMSLQKLYAVQAIPSLRLLLNDPVWWVRLQAALALKAFGKEGMEVLASQVKAKEPLAYEISQYALAIS